MNKIKNLTLAALLLAPLAALHAAERATEVCVYGGTASGLLSAIAVAKSGRQVVVIDYISEKPVAATSGEHRPNYQLLAVPLGSVKFDGGFWGLRIATNAAVTVPHNFRFLENSHRLSNFDRVRSATRSLRSPFTRATQLSEQCI